MKFQWKFPFQSSNEFFYVYNWNASNQKFTNELGLARMQPLKFTSFVHWKMEKNLVKVEEGSDLKEGTPTSWEISGDIPLPVALFVAMWTWSQKLVDEAIQRAKRQYKRCGKLVLQSAGTSILCTVCCSTGPQDYCIVCDKECGKEKFQGKICKTCAPRKNFCIKCGDATQGSKREGFLCRDCGLGKQVENCCKMTFTIK